MTNSESESRSAPRTNRSRHAKATGSVSAAKTTTSPGGPSASDATAIRMARQELAAEAVAMGTGLAQNATTATSLGELNARSAAQPTRTPAALAVEEGSEVAPEVDPEEAVVA